MTWLDDMPPEELPPVGRGFEVDDVELPVERLDFSREHREHAALLLLAIVRGATPEDIASGKAPAEDIRQVWTDELERVEALAHIDLLLDVLCPQWKVRDA